MAKDIKSFRKTLRQNWVVLLLLVVILFVGDKLRRFSYDTVPHPGETSDEYEYAWTGISLIKDKVPVGWTGIEGAYKSFELKKINVDSLYDKEPQRPPFIIVSPMLEKPPGFPLLIGTYAYLKGVNSFQEAGVGIIRRPMLYLGILTTILLFILAWRLYGKAVAILSVLLYSIIPTIVISSRIVVPENGFIPLFLGSLIMADFYISTRKRVFWILAAFLSALGFMMKQSALGILFSILLVFAAYVPKKGRTKILIGTLLISLSGILAFVIYGAYYSWETFVSIFLAQSKLLYGASSEIFYSAIMLSKLTATKFFTDGWITLGWISILVIAILEFKKEKGGTFLTLAVFAYFIVFLIFGSETYGWYRYPFFPFLSIAMARVFEKLYKAINVPVFLMMSLLPFGTAVHKIIGVEGFQKYVGIFRLISFASLLLVVYGLRTERKTLSRMFIVCIGILLVLLSIKEIYFYNYDKWFQAN